MCEIALFCNQNALLVFAFTEQFCTSGFYTEGVAGLADPPQSQHEHTHTHTPVKGKSPWGAMALQLLWSCQDTQTLVPAPAKIYSSLNIQGGFWGLLSCIQNIVKRMGLKKHTPWDLSKTRKKYVQSTFHIAGFINDHHSWWRIIDCYKMIKEIIHNVVSFSWSQIQSCTLYK